MGRVKSDIWIHFTEVKVGDVVRARCKGCDHEMVNNAERMKSHWASCSKKNDTSEGPSAPKQPRLTQSTLSIPTNSHKKEDEIVEHLQVLFLTSCLSKKRIKLNDL